MFRRLLSWFFTSREEVGNSGNPDLYPIKVEELSKQLKLKEEAERLGTRRIPGADAKILTGPEAAVVQRVEKARLDYVDWAVRRFRYLNAEIAQRRGATEAITRARQAHEEFGREASALLAERDALLGRLRETAKGLESELSDFKDRNNLTRTAHYPSGTGKFVRWAVLAVLVIVEGILNAVFFAQGLSGGLISGFAVAAGFALFNVLVAFLLGRFPVRYVFHSRLLPKLFGVLSTAFAVSFMFLFGLAIAHVRDGFIRDVPEPTQYALQQLLSNPLGLVDISSWGLCALSVLFAVSALVDGISYEDMYPGYGPLSRRVVMATDEYDSELDDLRNELEELRERHLEGLERQVLEGRTAVALFEARIDEKRSAGERLKTAMRDVENALSALLSMFRTENEVHRDGAPLPKYWRQTPELRHLDLPNFDISEDTARLLEQRQAIEVLLKEVDQIRGNIQESFNKQFNRLRPLPVQFDARERT